MDKNMDGKKEFEYRRLNGKNVSWGFAIVDRAGSAPHPSTVNPICKQNVRAVEKKYFREDPLSGARAERRKMFSFTQCERKNFFSPIFTQQNEKFIDCILIFLSPFRSFDERTASDERKIKIKF